MNLIFRIFRIGLNLHMKDPNMDALKDKLRGMSDPMVVKECAGVLRVAPRTIRKEIERKRLTSYQVGTNHRIFHIDLIRYFSEKMRCEEEDT